MNKKSNLPSQGRKITGRKHDPKYGHFFSIFLFPKRKIELHTSKYVSTLQSTDLEQAPYKQKCVLNFLSSKYFAYDLLNILLKREEWKVM